MMLYLNSFASFLLNVVVFDDKNVGFKVSPRIAVASIIGFPYPRLDIFNSSLLMVGVVTVEVTSELEVEP